MVCAFYVPQLVSGTTQYDGLDVHYASQRYLSDALRAGRLPFWTPYIFSGFPFLADVQVGAWYPLNWPFLVAGITPSSMSGELLEHTLIACGGAYALAVRWIGQRQAAVAAAIFYGLSGYFAAHSQHIGIEETTAWLPWTVLALDRVRERLSPRRLAVLGLLGAAVALPGHFQTALYTLTGAGVWVLLECGLQRAWRQAVRAAVGLVAIGVWGGLLAAIMILPGLELVAASARTELNALQIGIGYFQPDSAFTLVRPDYYGLLSGRYTGPGDVTQHYFYAGILLVPLAVLGLGHPRARRFAVLIGAPFLWYALGPAGGLFRVVARLPGFRSVELPMHGWFLPALGLALLGAAGVAALLQRVRIRWLGWALALVLFGDVLVFNELMDPLAYAHDARNAEALYVEPLRQLEQATQAQPGPVVRVYGPPLTAVGYRNHGLQSRIETTYGYNPLELRTYAEYAEAAEANPRLVAGLAASHTVSIRPGAPAAVSVHLQPNPDALPLAYFARRVVAEGDLATLDAATETLVGAPQAALAGLALDPGASATVVDRGDDWSIVHVRTASSNVLRLAIPAFPGWHASIDGHDLDVFTVDHAFLGVLVPGGEGDLRVWYEPRLFWPGAALSALALLACAIVLIRPRWRARQAAPGAPRP